MRRAIAVAGLLRRTLRLLRLADGQHLDKEPSGPRITLGRVDGQSAGDRLPFPSTLASLLKMWLAAVALSFIVKDLMKTS